MSIVANIAQVLHDAAVGVYSPDAALPAGATPISVGNWPPLEGQGLLVTTYPGGPEPDSRNGWEYPRLQVRVRAADPLEALALERQAYDALQFTTGGIGPRVIAGTDPWELQDCYAIQSEAQPLGQDSNGRSEYARNYQLTCRPVSA